MTDIVSPILQWVNANPEWAGLATFLISAGESVAIIGTIVPGSITMTAIGTLAGAGFIPLWGTLIWATLGAIVGDGISYWLGYYFKGRLRNMWPFRNNPNLLKSGEHFVHKYGTMSVFIGRFVGPVRALVPLVAGMLGMKPWQFTIANVASAIGWAPAYMLPGILLGAASLELPPDIALHVILVFLFILLFLLLVFWFLYKFLQLLHAQIDQIQSWIWRKLKKIRVLSPLTHVLKHHNPEQHHGQLNQAIYFIITSFLFVILACYVKAKGAENLVVNDAMYHFFRSIRTPAVDNVMINLTLLGQKQIILPVIIVVFIVFLVSKRWRTAFHALTLGILAAGSVYVIKNIIQSPRPWGIAQGSESFSMPSGHTTIATTVYMGLAFLIAASFRRGYRWVIYSLALLLILAVSTSRIYLGAHWFTDVLSAWLLSSSVLLIVIISYERHKEKPVKALNIFLIALVTLSLTFTYYHHQHFAQLKANYTLLNWLGKELNMQQWWQKNIDLPAYRVSLFGFPSQKINIEWLGDMQQIRKTLQHEGWENPPARDWVSTLHRLTDIRSTEYLPLVSLQYLDKTPTLVLTKQVPGIKSMLVLRLWDSNRVINHSTLWVGIISTVPRTFSWLYKKNQSEIEINPDFVLSAKQEQQWQQKIMLMEFVNGKNKVVQQNIMLIRPTSFNNNQTRK